MQHSAADPARSRSKTSPRTQLEHKYKRKVLNVSEQITRKRRRGRRTNRVLSAEMSQGMHSKSEIKEIVFLSFEKVVLKRSELSLALKHLLPSSAAAWSLVQTEIQTEHQEQLHFYCSCIQKTKNKKILESHL